jgi:hypothetical protein
VTATAIGGGMMNWAVHPTEGQWLAGKHARMHEMREINVLECRDGVRACERFSV